MTKYPVANVKKIEEWKLIPTDLGGRLLCRRYPKEEETEGGIVLPEGSKERPYGLGWIVQIAPGQAGTSGEIAIGDTLYVPEIMITGGQMRAFGDDDAEYFYLNSVSDAVLHWPAPVRDIIPAIMEKK